MIYTLTYSHTNDFALPSRDNSRKNLAFEAPTGNNDLQHPFRNVPLTQRENDSTSLTQIDNRIPLRFVPDEFWSRRLRGTYYYKP